MNDRELLQQFVNHRREQAFAELVRRNIDLVYSAALRQVRNEATAHDVTQTVFIFLAQKAKSIRSGEVIAGWLLVTTRYVALNALRADARRRRHEQKAAAMKSEHQPSDQQVDWKSIEPILDEAISRMSIADRDALTLRYLQNRSLTDVATAIGISQPAAQKRVNRAVAKLRAFFSRRGVTTSDAAIPTILLSNAVTSAPSSLTGEITHAALSAGKIATVPILGAKGAILMAMTTKAKTILLALAATALIGTGIPVAYRASHHAAASKAPHVDWKSEFSSAYELQPGEVMRHVGRPFIPARENYIREMTIFDRDFRPEALIFQWDGQELQYRRGTTTSFDVGDTLKFIADIWPQDTNINREMLLMPFDGDWVIRAGATQPERLAGLVAAMPDRFGAGMMLTQAPLQREAIVVRGSLDYKPLTDPPTDSQIATIRFYSEELPRGRVKRRRMAQNPSELLQVLGEQMGRPVVVEGTLGKVQPFVCEMYDSADLRGKPGVPSTGVTNAILANVAKQTSWQFTLERRTVPTWQFRQGI